MAQNPSFALAVKVPVLLLKTKSTPGDSYEDLLSGETDGCAFEPTFVPVLHHTFQKQGMATVRHVLQQREINAGNDASYGGLIFTSQRAVEAFASLVDEKKGPSDSHPHQELKLKPLDRNKAELTGLTGTEEEWPHLQNIPVYSVGPATTRALQSVSQHAPLQIFGEHTGNGDALAKYILDHYGRWYQDRQTKPPLLFLVGEQRRDIIPKTLMNTALPSEKRIQVDEVVVYGTGVMESFPQDFEKHLKDTEGLPMRWVVVFSPTGCEGMLRGLGMLDESTGKVKKDGLEGRKTFIATIGPTTRDYLRRTFDLDPDVCAEEPSPTGVQRGILDFMGQQT
ncbi:uroporphyrinogen-III synthase [Colletotrichum costaricense]|uniref:Uroporphyrinogen-III synthase n=1 Tax=Colletotrichum costaricense TaxID=1209916 RepID=A0AAJ0E091_9PEZI|nr:uroporphyrinogen-III synthase [Colletotrichum costaricense]KAK1527461.1 uroporphyrinogen-III synthase [Colletotrichum costaricense]